MWDFLAMRATNSIRIIDHLRGQLRDLWARSEDRPHLRWYIEQTLDGCDPPTVQLHERMERLWWLFSEAWEENV
eukprot:14184232-Alexandrium_andersonii.AAC.1